MTVLDTGRIAVRDTELYVDVAGQGPPVLVMHGGLGVDHTCFRPWLDPLGDTASLVYYDHRGNGRSARAPLDDVDHDTWVEDADALRAALGHERVVVLGHSYGGFLALRYALAHPDRVRGLILVSTAAVMEHWDSIHQGLAARHATPAQLRAFEDRPFEDDADFGATLAALLPLYFHRRPCQDVTDRLAGMSISVEASVAGGRCMADYDVRADLARIGCPALVLAGRHDFVMPVAATAAPLAAGLADSELTVFEDSGHFPYIEQAALFGDVVRSWLGRLEEQR